MILFIATGGTIDKDYPKTTRGYAFEIADPAIGRILEKVNPGFRFDIIQALQKDSLDITAEDRNLLLDICRKSPSDQIIITHGTDTMVETAGFLHSGGIKTIVLVGSLSPARFKSSDAVFNIGFAFAAAMTLQPGVYIAMNGQVFAADQVRKNRAKNQFEKV